MKKLLLLVSIISASFINAQPHFLGMNDGGGFSMNGNIFSFDASNNIFINEHDFFEYEGGNPVVPELVEYNGRLYGTTSNPDVLFSYDINNEDYEKHVDFNDVSIGNSPSGSLILIGNKFYGITSGGGANYDGNIYEFDPSNNQITTLFVFNNNGSSTGENPLGGMLLASNGKLYGTTYIGGTNSDGVIFSFDIATSTYTKLFDFNASTTGEKPKGNLIQASNGIIYGMTERGGTSSSGTIFSFNPTSNTHTTLFHFTSSSMVSNPEQSLFEASNGKLYGISSNIFEFDITTNTFINKGTGTLSPSLEGNFIEPITGKLYALGYGQKIYEYDLTTSALTLIHDPMGMNLTNSYGSWTNTHGLLNNGSLIKASNGKLYGCTYRGGIAGRGTLFEYDMVLDSMENKIDFGVKTISQAQGVLMEASNGKFYGCSREGGDYNFGTFFEYNEATKESTVLVHFKDSMGVIPRNLIEENGIIYGIGHGRFYGTTNVRGIVFKYNISQNTYSFNANTAGLFATFNPIANGFTKTTNGHLYSLLGGYIVHYDIALDTLIIDKELNTGSGMPRNPEGMLMQAANGLLFGTSRIGGVYNEGTLFSYDITSDTLIVIQNLYAGIGKNPTSTPVEAANGMIYFTAYEGGNYSDGTMLEYNPTTGVTVRKQNFRSSSNGKWPSGHLTLASDGNIYGLLTGGGSGGHDGVIYKYQPGTTTITKLHGYDGVDGNPFVNNGLVEYMPTSTSINSINNYEENIQLYPNPSSGYFSLKSENNIKSIEIYNSLGAIIFSQSCDNSQVFIDLTTTKNGLYFIRINNSSTLKKLIISK